MVMQANGKIILKIYLIAFVVSLLIIIYYAPAYVTLEYLSYDFYYKPHIEQDMDNISRNITLTPNNDIEKTQKIIQWENTLNLDPFDRNSLIDIFRRSKSNETSWFIYLRKANCRERSLIFEDLANRTNLLFRRIEVDGFIDPNTTQPPGNHRWDEVWLDGDWRIADSGFSLYYPKNNNSFFTSENGYLIGHVAVLDADGKYLEDRTNSYINKTGKLFITVINDGKPIKNADISIKLRYKNITTDVVGKNLKAYTNDSGIYEINLGTYNDTFYVVNVSYRDLFKEKNVSVTTEKTNILVMELVNSSFSAN